MKKIVKDIYAELENTTCKWCQALPCDYRSASPAGKKLSVRPHSIGSRTLRIMQRQVHMKSSSLDQLLDNVFTSSVRHLLLLCRPQKMLLLTTRRVTNRKVFYENNQDLTFELWFKKLWGDEASFEASSRGSGSVFSKRASDLSTQSIVYRL